MTQFIFGLLIGLAGGLLIGIIGTFAILYKLSKVGEDIENKEQ